MMGRGIVTDNIRGTLLEGNYLEALLQTSASLESLFFMKLLFEKKINEDLMANWTLSRYIDWTSKMGLLDSAYVPILRKFNTMRNCVAHTGFALPRIKNNLQKSEKLRKLIIEVCDFIDAYSIQYSDISLEEGYANFVKKSEKKFNRLFDLPS